MQSCCSVGNVRVLSRAVACCSAGGRAYILSLHVAWRVRYKYNCQSCCDQELSHYFQFNLLSLTTVKGSMGCGASQPSGVPAADGPVCAATVPRACTTSMPARPCASSRPGAFSASDQVVRGNDAGVYGGAKVSSLTASGRKRKRSPAVQRFADRQGPFFDGGWVQRAGVGGGPDPHASSKRASFDKRENSWGERTETHRSGEVGA
jgi:hypothetical protein